MKRRKRQKRKRTVELIADGDGFRVDSVTNAVAPKPGTVLTASTVQQLIDDHAKVRVRANNAPDAGRVILEQCRDNGRGDPETFIVARLDGRRSPPVGGLLFTADVDALIASGVRVSIVRQGSAQNKETTK